MTNSTKQAIRTVSNTSSVSALGHKTLTITESTNDFVPKLLEKIIDANPKKQEAIEKNVSSSQSKRNTPLAKKNVISIEENILEEENENQSDYNDSYQNMSQTYQTKSDAELATQNSLASQSNANDLKKNNLPKTVKKASKKLLKQDKTSLEDVVDAFMNKSKHEANKSPRQPKKEESTGKTRQRKYPSKHSDIDIHTEENFDLYKTQNASLLYIKQKYKMYLDWLAENSSIENLLNHANERGSKKHSDPQLNWYQYEKTHINSNNKNYSKYLESLNSSRHHRATDGPTLVSHSSFSHHICKNQNGNTLTKNRPITNLSTVNSDYMIPHLVDKSEDSLGKSNKGVKFDKVNNKESNYFNTKFNSHAKIENRMNGESSPTNNNANEIFYPAITSFLSQLNNSHSSNNSTPLAMSFSLQTQPKKPILKSYQSSEYSNSLFNQRRGSVLSIGSDQSSGKSSIQSLSNNNNNNNNATSSKSKSNNKKETVKIIQLQHQQQSDLVEHLNVFNQRIGNVKLPPIVRCSEDFYAVLHAMEKDRLV